MVDQLGQRAGRLIALDPRIVLLLIALGCAYVVSPELAGVLASVVILVIASIRSRLTAA